MQEDSVTGLQIRKGGECVSVKPIPNAFVVNVGDVFEVIYYDMDYWELGSTRALNRDVATKNKARLSYASFLAPRGS
ncbi:hypothetical protein M0R45_029177 [Rubus argutus]|uniref:Isopenicillin N synthase-like Fe(2+) 2OG dioxygenase domain-containing protein n=1 Tax=Rubus argutus TaxID=59490 RepID=A0AAW1W9E4_RUBAR